MGQPELGGTGEGSPATLFGSDGTKWIALLVDALGRLQTVIASSALPSGAATEATLADAVTALQLIDDLRNALGSVHGDLLRVEAEDGDKIFSFESVVEEQIADLNLAGGTNYVYGTAVPAGKVWKITHLSMWYAGTAPTFIEGFVHGLASGIHLKREDSPTSGHAYMWDGEVYLQAGDQMAVVAAGATVGDDLAMRYCGLQMNAP